MMHAFAAILGGLKDVIFGRLTLFAILNLVIALAIAIMVATLLIRYAVPLIPDGAGWLSYLSTAGELAASLFVVVLVIALSPAISMAVGGILFDIAAERVEKAIGAPEGRSLPIYEGIWNGARIALPALALNLIAIPLYFVPVLNAVTFYALNAFLMWREYAAVTATRRMSYAEAVTLRKRHGGAIFLVGLACSFIPFFAPLVGASAMTRLMHRLHP
jgi:CysZ protein